MQYKEEVHPVGNLTIQADSGLSVLKQTYSVVIRDGSGMDVTERECETCVGQKERYVLFKDSSNYVIVQVTGLGNDRALEERIIRSIVY